MRIIPLLCGVILLATAGCALLRPRNLAVAGLRCEQDVDPLGVDVPQPRLGWTLQSAERGQAQTAYQVLVASSSALLAQDQGDL